MPRVSADEIVELPPYFLNGTFHSCVGWTRYPSSPLIDIDRAKAHSDIVPIFDDPEVIKAAQAQDTKIEQTENYKDR